MHTLETSSSPWLNLGVNIDSFGRKKSVPQHRFTLENRPHLPILFFFTDTATPEISTLPLPDPLPIFLSRVFRGKFLAGLKRLHHRHQLCCAGPTVALADPQQFAKLMRRLHRHDWVVYAKPAFGGQIGRAHV